MYMKCQQENSLKQLQMHTFGDNEVDTELKNISKKKKKTCVVCNLWKRLSGCYQKPTTFLNIELLYFIESFFKQQFQNKL